MANVLRLPSSRVLAACRVLSGVGSSPKPIIAAGVVLRAMESGVAIPRSARLDLGRMILDPNFTLDRDIRIRGAKALTAFRERNLYARAKLAICGKHTHSDVLQAAAMVLLGSPPRRLSHNVVSCLVRAIRRHGLIRCPATNLLAFSTSAVSRHTRTEK